MDLFASESRLFKKKPALSALLLTGSLLLTPLASAVGVITPMVPQKTALQSIEEADYYPLGLASVHLQKGENAKALKYLVETVERNPVHILGLFHLGCAYLELAKDSDLPEQQAVYLDQAQQALERVVDLNDELTLVYFKLGKVALMKNDIEAAKRFYTAGLRTDPSNAALIFNLARVYDQNNEKAEAIRYYQKTIETDPGFTYAYNNLALLYEESKDYANAEKAYRQALKRNGRYNLARLNLGNMLAAKGDYKTAKKLFDEALAQEPQNEWAHYYQGNLFLRMNAYDQAVSSYNEALALNANHATTYYLLAIALTKLNRMDEAMQASLHYMQLAPDGEYAKEMKTLIMTVKLSQSNGLYFTPTPASAIPASHNK